MFAGFATYKAWALVLGLALVAPGSAPSEKRGYQTAPQPIVVMAEMVNRQIVYKVNSKPALPDILRVLSELEERRGKDCPVIALVDSRAPINEFGNIDGVAGKAQLTVTRFYVFNKESGLMGTVQFGKDIPFTPNPPLD